MASLKLIQLNIERDKHFERIFPFLAVERPDILTVQEISERDVPRFSQELDMHAHFAPMNSRTTDGVSFVQGIAVFSRSPMRRKWSEYYAGDEHKLPEYDGTTPESKRATQNFSVAFAEIEAGDSLYRIGTTHFPWTADGSASDFQRTDMHALLAILDKNVDFILTGDFNAPRGGEIFSMLAQKYTDHVPQEYTTSIDGTLHRAGPLPYMVDGLFSSPGYTAEDVTMRSGVSDHCAIIARVRASKFSPFASSSSVLSR